jgi:hypothetical protein
MPGHEHEIEPIIDGEVLRGALHPSDAIAPRRVPADV